MTAPSPAGRLPAWPAARRSLCHSRWQHPSPPKPPLKVFAPLHKETSTRTLLRSFAAAAVAALFAFTGASPAAEKDAPARVAVGKPAPPIELPATSIETALPDKKGAKTLSLADFKGKKNVVTLLTIAPWPLK